MNEFYTAFYFICNLWLYDFPVLYYIFCDNISKCWKLLLPSNYWEASLMLMIVNITLQDTPWNVSSEEIDNLPFPHQ